MTSLIEARRINKCFGGVPVLRDVSFDLRPGEVHGILGENGAGKSTLMKILSGLLESDSGEIWLKGAPVEFHNAHAGIKAGIAMIAQEPMPFLDLNVAENVLIGQEPCSPLIGWIDKKALHERARAVLKQLNADISTHSKMRALRIAQFQLVEIAKALAHKALLIIMDEPTSALTEREAEALFVTIKQLQQRGVSIAYISHRLEEVFRLADRITVLRDGVHVVTRDAALISRDEVISFMVGRSLQEVFPTPCTQPGEIALEVRNLTRHSRFRNISFTIRHGEILGLGGLIGAGRSDVVNAIYGLDPADGGEIFVDNERVEIENPQDALHAGIGLVTEDRKTYGFVQTLDLRRNMTLASLENWCRYGFINRATETAAVYEEVKTLSIKATGHDQLVQRLSGGNQQKVVLGRTWLTSPGILLLDEPTKGIDIGAKSEVHKLITRFVAAGNAVLLVSSELPELLSLSHRLIIMREGEITAELNPRSTTPEEVLRYAIPE